MHIKFVKKIVGKLPQNSQTLIMHHVIIIKNDRKRGQKNPNDTLRIVEDCLKLKKRTKNFKR